MSGEPNIVCDRKLTPLYTAMRQGSLRMEIEQAKALVGDGDAVELKVAMWVSLDEGRLTLNLRGVPGQEAFEQAKSIFWKTGGKVVSIKASNHLQIEAHTDAGIPVVLKDVNPVVFHELSSSSSCGGWRSHLEARFHKLVFPAVGLDALDSKGLKKLLKQTGEGKPDTGEEEASEDAFFAILPGVAQRIFNSGSATVEKHPFHGEQSSSRTDCFTGSLQDGAFCLEMNDSGMLIDFRCPVGCSSTEEVRRRFDGLLQAIALIHSCNPRPDYFCHRRDQRVVERWMLPQSNLERNPPPPLGDEDLQFPTSTSGEQLFATAASFFGGKTEESSEFKQALWLMRESCQDGVPKEIAVLTFCSVFEGLIKRYRAKKPCGKLKSEQLKVYRWIEPIESKLGMPFEWFEPAVTDWNTFRNPLAHGFFEIYRNERRPLLDAYFRLSGAIYMILARRMGFTGSMPRSMLGDVEKADFNMLPKLTAGLPIETPNPSSSGPTEMML